ncbi:MAG: response regulator [Myxococcota bacterium]|nr:response regulator [Myxococcota bacterium]
MIESQTGVFIVSGPNPCAEQHIAPLSSLLERCQEVLVASPSEAACFIGLGDMDTWPELPAGDLSISISIPMVYVWFESFASKEAYDAVVRRLPNAVFVHGYMGLVELTTLLENAGFLAGALASDPLAEDVFFRMRGDYLNTVAEELDQLSALAKKTSREKTEVWAETLRRIAGSAGTYEFDILSRTATESLEVCSEKKLSAVQEKALHAALRTSINEEAETYKQQVEACLPTLVELDVRQRVLALADDAQVSKQLQFALTHSRMQTVLYDNPAEILAALHTVQPDILVVQQAMRHFDGLDLAAYVRGMERFESLPILALLQDSAEATIARATRGGVDSWLTIPFSAANVALGVLNLLQRVEVARKLGGRDALTGLYTKEALLDRLAGDLSRVARGGQQLAVMLIHLTSETDTPRLAFLDLTSISNRVFRRSDLLAKYNETTLAAVLPGIDTRTILSALSRFRTMLGDAHTVEIAASITDGSAEAAALLADVETRLTHVLGGATASAIGIFTPEVPRETSRAPKILIADTDEAIVNLLRFFLAREGFEVDDVRTGTDTLDYLEKARSEDTLPEVMVLEAFLPGTDGFQILERVAGEFGNRIAVIMISVSPSEERVSKAFEMGATDFVAKPFRVPEMVARIRNGLLRTAAI